MPCWFIDSVVEIGISFSIRFNASVLFRPSITESSISMPAPDTTALSPVLCLCWNLLFNLQWYNGANVPKETGRFPYQLLLDVLSASNFEVVGSKSFEI